MFSLNLVRDICLTKSLENSELCLMDTDSERLDAINELCRRYAEEIGIRIAITKTIERTENQARAFLNEIINLPYHTEMKQHYK